MAEPTALHVGLDVGGTKTELVALAAGAAEPLVLFGPGSNLQRMGVEHTAEVVAALLREAFGRFAGARPAGVCLGLAGAGRPDDRAALEAALRDALRPVECPLSVLDDAQIALEAAFDGGSGIIVIAGTGSICYARTTSGETLRAGGWGYLIGDEGSGYQIGLHGLRAAAAHFDGGPPTLLAALLAERHEIREPAELIRRVYRDGWPLAEAAPLVLEAAAAGDPPALRILEEQAGLLADQVGRLVRRAAGRVEPQLSLLGGLAGAAVYHARLAGALAARLPDWRLRPPARRAALGALRLAQRL